MTPAQLRACSTVVRLGSVDAAVSELGMSDAGGAAHIARLHKGLADPLFTCGFRARRVALVRPGEFSDCSAGQPSR